MARWAPRARQGWLEEPTCQACHTGTAMSNRGQIRYTSVFDDRGSPREPATDLRHQLRHSRRRALAVPFLNGHGGLQCEACHGSTHAEYPSSHANDNVQTSALQGHAGMLSECTVCHNAAVPRRPTAGRTGCTPWAGVDRGHTSAPRGKPARAKPATAPTTGARCCRARGDRTINAGEFGTRVFGKGAAIGCYSCHNGPRSGEAGGVQ